MNKSIVIVGLMALVAGCGTEPAPSCPPPSDPVVSEPIGSTLTVGDYIASCENLVLMVDPGLAQPKLKHIKSSAILDCLYKLD